jgi:hypothetical protein
LHCGFGNVNTIHEPQNVSNKNQPAFGTHPSRHHGYHLPNRKKAAIIAIALSNFN